MYNNRKFWELINNHNYKIGVEVGVREGWHSMDLLNNSNLDILYGVDILRQESVGDVEKKFPIRYKYLLKSSIEASKDFEDNYFDFIYIDAWHSYESVKEDLNHWWPKLKVGGLMCGDDYMDFDCPGECRFGIIQAVEEFAEKNGLFLEILGKEDCFNTKEERMVFGIKQGNELNKKIVNQPHSFEFNPQWYFYKK